MTLIPLLLALAANGASAEVRIDLADSPIGAMRSEWVHVEPHVAVNPGDPGHWVVGTIVTDPTQREHWSCAALTTTDAGRTWRRHDLEMDRCIDPWAIIAADGTAIVTAIEIQSGHEGDDRFVLLRSASSDRGQTWSDQRSLGGTFEHNMVVEQGHALWMAARRTIPMDARPQRVLHLGRSDDRLASVETINEVLPVGETGHVIGTGLAPVGDDTIVITYSGNEPYHVAAIRSTDGGRTFSPPIAMPDRCGQGEGTFGGYPFMAGRGEDLFHACAGPEYLGYWLTVSRDGGATWEPALKVDGVGEHTQVRTPMLAVGADGSLGMAWYDRRHDPELACQDVYFAGSIDGGRTFTEPLRLTSETSCPNAPGNGRAGAQSWNSGGDYSSMAALPDGRFLVVWADSRSGRFQLRFAVVGLGR